MDELQFVAFSRHYLRFQAARSADEQNLDARQAALELVCNRNPGKYVTTGSSCCDDNSHNPLRTDPRSLVALAWPAFSILNPTHAFSCFEMFSNTPAANRLIARDVPPALINGSGIPFVGTSDRVTLMLKNAWATIITVSPTANSRPKTSGA